MARGDITFETEGLDVLAAKMKTLDHDMRGKVGRHATREGAKYLAGVIRQNAPAYATQPHHIKDNVRVRSVKAESTRWSWVYAIYIGSKTFYAKFHEFGTSREPAKPFVGPSFNQAMSGMVDKAKEVLERRLKKL